MIVLLEQSYGKDVDSFVTLFRVSIICSLLHHSSSSNVWTPGYLYTLFPPELCVFWNFHSHTWGQSNFTASQGKIDASTLLLKYLRSCSVVTQFGNHSKLYVVFFLCLIPSFVSKFFQPSELEKSSLKVVGCFSGHLHSEVMCVYHAHGKKVAVPLK